jgi:hypothetical protein
MENNAMRRLIVLSFVSLDGVIQGPGGPTEDTSGNFKYGGWTVPYFDDFAGKVMGEQMSRPMNLLLGRMPPTGRSMRATGRESTRRRSMLSRTRD